MSNTSTSKIPLFPISISILPKEFVPLHIFEARYRSMVSDALKNDTQFGIIYKENEQIKNIGCSVFIEKVYKKYQDGKYDILIRGKKRFKILNLFKEGSLWFGEVEFLNENYNEIDKKKFSTIIDKYIKLLLMFDIEHDIQNEMMKKVSFDFTKNILIPNNIKQEFLELEDESERIIFIDNFLDSIFSNIKKDKNKIFKGRILN